MSASKKLYQYSGPVMEFDKCIERNWKAETIAISEKKAMSNFVYRYKKEHNRDKLAKIELTGKVSRVQ